MDELTDLLALFPETLSGSITIPYVTGSVTTKDGCTTYNYLCKNKKVCVAGKDDERFQKYRKDFDALLKEKRSKVKDSV